MLYRSFFVCEYEVFCVQDGSFCIINRAKSGGSIGFVDFLKEKGCLVVDFFALGKGKKILGKYRCIVYNKVSHFFRRCEI